jgi:hypothetical protein
MVQTGFMQLDQMDDAVQFVRIFFLEIAAVTSATPEKQKARFIDRRSAFPRDH